jgi:hypothetical protein
MLINEITSMYKGTFNIIYSMPSILFSVKGQRRKRSGGVAWRPVSKPISRATYTRKGEAVIKVRSRPGTTNNPEEG